MAELNIKIPLSEDLKKYIGSTLENGQAIIDENKRLCDKIERYEKFLNRLINEDCGSSVSLRCIKETDCSECWIDMAKSVLLESPRKVG